MFDLIRRFLLDWYSLKHDRMVGAFCTNTIILDNIIVIEIVT